LQITETPLERHTMTPEQNNKLLFRIPRVTWKEKLTTEEIEHLRENKVNTFKRMRAVRKMQRSMAKMDGKEPCYDCRAIAVKLGIEEELIGEEA